MKQFILIILSFLSIVVCEREVSLHDESSVNSKRLSSYLAENLPWWKSMSIYNIYPKSFKDSNGDGIGDIKGVTQNLQHIADLGFDYVWLNPVYPSPNRDNGYDISNYLEIDPTYGTMSDFDDMLAEVKRLGMKLMMDFVFNHCSPDHDWFKRSVKGEEHYKDYFIWRDPKGYDENGKPIVPNNWLCIYGGTAWTWVEERRQFYFHLFTDGQPEFNLRNPFVIEELKNILRFWLDKGVTGIRMDAVKHLFEDAQFRDEPYKTEEAEKRKSENYRDLNHIYIPLICRNLTNYVEIYRNSLKRNIHQRTELTEVYTTRDRTLKWLDYVHLVFSFELVSLPYSVDASQLDGSIRGFLENMPAGAAITWNAENHDFNRRGLVWGEESIDIFNILLTLLPGNLCLYYGEEIGMTDLVIRPDQIRDTTKFVIPRDQGRTPMQWDDTLNAGFSSSCKPWLPVNPNYWRISVQNEKSDPLSHYNIFKKLMNLPKTAAVRYGQFTSYVHSSWVYMFTRKHGDELYVVILNIGTESEIVDFSTIPNLTEKLKVLIPTINSAYRIGDVLSANPGLKDTTILRPKSGLVLTTFVNKEKKTDDKKSDDSRPTSSSETSKFRTLYVNFTSDPVPFGKVAPHLFL